MDRNKVAENLLTFVPFLYKKLHKACPIPDISRQQLELLYFINCKNGKPMSYYSNKMMIPKPNLTSVADRIIETGLAVRELDPADRRVVILSITEKGKEVFYEHQKMLKQWIQQEMQVLEDNDIKRINELFDELKIIFAKIDDSEG